MHNTSKAVSSSDTKDTYKLSSKKKNTPTATSRKFNAQTGGRSFVVPAFVPRDSSGGKGFSNSSESITPDKPGTGIPFKVSNARKSSKSKFDADEAEPNFVDRVVLEVGVRDNSGGKSFVNPRRESVIPEIPGCGGPIEATHRRNLSQCKIDRDDIHSDFLDRLVLEVEARESGKDKNLSPESIEEKSSSPSFFKPQSGRISSLSVVARWRHSSAEIVVCSHIL